MSSILEGNSSEEEATSTSQNGNKIDSARSTLLLFDIDGVITEPVTGKVALEVIDEIVGTLERGEPIAFNTGRGLKWIFQDIVPPIRHKLSSRSILNKLCIAYEKGAFRLTFNEQGEPEKPVVTPGIDFVPLFLRMEVLELILTKYTATMFSGEEKGAILSPQFRPGSDFTKYKEDQERLVVDLHGILQQHGLDTRFRVDPTRIATDIEDSRIKRQRIPDGRTYLIGKVKTHRKQTYSIAIARCSDQGTDASQRLAHDIIHDLDPQLILVVGIATKIKFICA